MDYMLAERKGRRIQVSYDGGKHWESTGCRTKMEAEILLRKRNDLKLCEYAKDFYKRTDSNSYQFMMKMRNIKLVPSTLWTKQTLLDKYILPAFGSLYLTDIRSRDISRWVLSLRSYRNGKPLGYSMKKLVMWAFREVLDYAMEEGMVETNEAKKVKAIRKLKQKQPYLSKEELDILFPNDETELVRIWGYKDYALFFMIMRDTGFRPSEVSGLKYEDIRDDAVYTDRIFDVFTNKVEERIKTSSKGQKYKVGTFSEKTLRLLGDGSGYIFPLPEMNRRRTNYIFKKVCKSVLGRDDVSQKCLRHAFMTERISILPRELIMELMGHTVWEDCYDDRTPEMVIDALRTALNRCQAQPHS